MSTPAAGGAGSSRNDGTGQPPRFLPRTGEQVPLLNASPFLPFAFAWQIRPPAHNLVVVVKGTFDIVPGQRAVPSKEQLPPSGDVRWDDQPASSLRYASDFAVFKPKADVLLVGHAYPSDNTSVGVVTLEVGTLQRTVAVFGDRSWGTLGAQSKPAAFDKLALRWERAMGGPLSEANPVGRGFKTGVLLPNLERRETLVSSTRDAPAPACFAPIAPEWKARTSKLGSFGSRWLEKRWPFFPEEFDFAFFNAAPAEQQVPYPRGDEPFSLRGVQPKQATVTGTLPGLAPQVFAQMTPEAGGGINQVPMQLDTVWFDSDALRIVLVWRGLCTVRDDEASDITTLFVTATGPGESLSAAQARDRLLAEAEAAGMLGSEPKAQPVATSPVAQPVAPQAPTRPAAWLPQPTAPAAAPPPVARSAGMPLVREPPPAPVVSRGQILAFLAAREPLAGRDLTGADLSGLDLSKAALQGTILRGANLRSTKLDGADLTQANLAQVDAEGASFAQALLKEADLEGARVPKVSFAKANLEGANLSGIAAAGAVFCDAIAPRAVFARALLAGAQFDRAALEAADFTDAAVDEASWKTSHLDNARFYRAAGAKCRFDGASMTDARMDGARLPGAAFTGAKAQQSVWEAADVQGAVFQQADIQRANFKKARLEGAVFNTADGRNASFRKSKMKGVRMLKANLMGASFEGADLEGADLRGANLFQAETWRANLKGAQFDLALLSGSKLAR